MEKKIEISVGDVIVVNHVEIRAEKRTGWQGCECCFFHKSNGSCMRFPCNARERKDG